MRGQCKKPYRTLMYPLDALARVAVPANIQTPALNFALGTTPVTELAACPTERAEIASFRQGILMNSSYPKLKETIEHLKARDLQIEKVEEYDYGHFALIRDPEGNATFNWIRQIVERPSVNRILASDRERPSPRPLRSTEYQEAARNDRAARL
jgi:hypothetical protein